MKQNAKSIVITFVCVAALALGAISLAGCGGNSATSKSSASSVASSQVSKTSADVQMKYISREDATKALGDDAYLFIDLRKVDDYEIGHIPGAVSADIDAARKGDTQAGLDTLESVLTNQTGSPTGGDKKLILVCYSGARYAQTGTNLLNEMGANMDNVFTLEGGMKAWTGEIDK